MGNRGYNKGKVQISLLSVTGKVIRDNVHASFINQRVKSFSKQVTLSFKGRALTVSGLPAGPQGMYQVFFTPGTYRTKSVFLALFRSSAVIEEILFIDAGQATPKFPSFSTLKQKSKTRKITEMLDGTKYGGNEFNIMSDLPKAGLLNLCAKMSATTFHSGESVLNHVTQVQNIKPARIYAEVSEELLEKVRGDRAGFHAVDGGLHNFPRGWDRIKELGSFKTHDKAGNLQLTFATNARGKYLVDADIDDHQGVKHAFDVIQHGLTGKDTHPYNIHQILIFFQGVQPAYGLS